MVEQIQSRIPSWQRFVAGVQTDSQAKAPAWPSIAQRFSGDTGQTGQSLGGHRPHEVLETIVARDHDAAQHPHGLTFGVLLGIHAELLVVRLQEARSAWDSAQACAQSAPASAQPFQSDLDLLSAALDGAMQHTLFLTFLGAIDGAHVGDSLAVDDHCAGWGLLPAQVDMTWQWLTTDPHVFGGEPLRVAVDKAHRCVYREASILPQRCWYASALLWGGALTYGLVLGLFVILHVAGVWHYSATWTLKLLVLLLFVSIGAWAHIGAKFVNVNYDNPMSVYSARSKLDWVSLYWVAVLQMYIPVGVVVASLWGAGNVPTSFQKLGTALLAGYSADSFVSALSKSKSATQSAAATNAPTTATATTTPVTTAPVTTAPATTAPATTAPATTAAGTAAQQTPTSG
jgi:hypothetical protein